MTDLDYLKLSKPAKMAHDLGQFFASIPRKLLGAVKGIGLFFVRLLKGLGTNIADLVTTFKNGDWKTRLSYLIMGFGSCARGQWGRGILFFLFFKPSKQLPQIPHKRNKRSDNSGSTYHGLPC